MQDITVIFKDQYLMMRKLNKKRYEDFMNDFRDSYGSIIDELINESKSSDNAPREVGAACVEQIFSTYQKRGKIKRTLMMELELFMIYYLFPAILLTGDNVAASLCDGIRDSWNETFSKNINYTDYETIHGGFVTKIFGVPVGE